MYGPVIEGEKLVLRPHQPEDAPDFVRMLSNPVVTRWLQFTNPPSLEQEQAWVAARATDPTTIGWTVQVDGYCVGSVGFDAIDWRNQHATAGIFLGHPEIWRTGIATEAAQLLADYAFTQHSWRTVRAGYISPNVASAKLQASIGLKPVGRWHGVEWRDGAWVDHVLTELPRTRWLKMRAARMAEK